MNEPLCYSCDVVCNTELVFNGHIEDECISFCCENHTGIPKLKISDNPEKNILSVFELRHKMLEAGKRMFSNCMTDDDIDILKGCIKCPRFSIHKYPIDNKIHFINLSLYPSPCQSYCIYCEFRKNEKMINSSNHCLKKYELVFEMITSLRENEYIAADIAWQISCGEITIHPLKKQILNLVNGESVVFCTNCFRYDSDISRIISARNDNLINVSIDCGTEKTWKKMKRYGNLNGVIKTIQMYLKHCNPSQIIAKYVFIPGVNDNNDDYIGIIKILHELGIAKLVITPDFESDNIEEDLKSASVFQELLKNNEIAYEVYLY